MFSSRSKSSQSLSNKVNCHFCNSDSILLPKGQDPRNIPTDTNSNLHLNLSLGSINDWICSQCDSRNLLDSNGKITSWNPQMNDESTNGKSRAIPLNLNRIRIGDGKGEGVFCRECLSNQRLALALLSSFDDSNQSSSSTSNLESIQLFKKDIQKRYPQVCEKCLVKVEEIIEESDRNARSLMMGELMRRGLRKKQNGIGNGNLINGSPIRRTQDGGKEGREQGDESRVKEMIWRIRGLAWVLTHFLSLGTTLMGVSTPQQLPCCPQASASFTISSHTISNFNFNFQPRLFPTLSICFLSIFWTVWDPTWLRMTREAKKGVKLKVRGRDDWIRMQLQLYFLRFFLFTLVLSETLPELLTWSFNSILALIELEISKSTLVRSFCLLGLLIQVILLFSSFQNLTTHRPKPPKLRSSASRLSPSISKNESSISNPISQSRIDEGSRDQDALWNLSLRDDIGTIFDRNQPFSSFGVPSTFGQNPAPAPGRFEDLFSRHSDSRKAEDEVDHQQEAFQQQEEMLSDDSEEDSIIPSSSLRWSTNPFGLRSRINKDGKGKEKQRRRSDEMDWTPSNDITPNSSAITNLKPNSNSQSSSFNPSRRNDFQFGPQRFFAPEKPTGLEDLFKDSLGIDDNDRNEKSEKRRNKGQRSFTRPMLENDIILTLLFALFAFFIFALFASGQFLKLFSIDYGSSQVQNGLINGERSYEIGQNLASRINEGLGFGFLKKEKEAEEVEKDEADVLGGKVDVGNEDMEIDIEEASFYEHRKDVEEEFW